MKQEKKICFCLTARRVVLAVLLVTSLINLLIVGMVVEADEMPSRPSLLSSPTQVTDQGLALTQTGFAPTATTFETFTPASTSTEPATLTMTVTSTASATPTLTQTGSPTPTACVKTSYWPQYIVQAGDWLSSIARATGSTVAELIQANCLTSTVIYPGQILYVPRLPVPTPTPTPTSVPTYFQNPDGQASVCDYPPYAYFSVLPIDPDGIKSVSVIFSVDGGTWWSLEMTPDGATYYGWSALSESEAQLEVLYFYFVAVDGRGNSTDSIDYKSAPAPCQVGG